MSCDRLSSQINVRPGLNDLKLQAVLLLLHSLILSHYTHANSPSEGGRVLPFFSFNVQKEGEQ